MVSDSSSSIFSHTEVIYTQCLPKASELTNAILFETRLSSILSDTKFFCAFIMSSSKLFQAIHVGDMDLSHRVVLAPMTRYRSTDAHVPGHLVPEYYAQRASTPGTLLVTEGVFIDARAGGYANVPGLSPIVYSSRWCV